MSDEKTTTKAELVEVKGRTPAELIQFAVINGVDLDKIKQLLELQKGNFYLKIFIV